MSTGAELAALGIRERRLALVTRSCSVAELIAAALAQIEARDGELRAVAGRRGAGAGAVGAAGASGSAGAPGSAGAAGAAAEAADLFLAASARARAADRRLAAGDAPRPLEGTAIVVKDNVAQAGQAVRAGTREELWPPGGNARVLDLLERAGAIVVGRAAMSPWAIGGTGADAVGGTPANVAFPGRVPGGSSSGSATAVAAGLVPLALGSDSGGSIRMPAAAQEIFGLRPSRASIPSEGIFPVSRSLDVAGPLTRTVADLIEAIAVLLPAATAPPPAATMRVAVCATPWPGAHPATAALVHAAADRLAAAGVALETVSLDGISEARSAAAHVLLSEAAELHAERLRSAPESFTDSTRDRLLAAASHDAADARRVAARWDAFVAELLARHDALLLPALIGPLADAGVPETAEAARDIGTLVLPFSIVAGPSLVVPVPRADPALPGAIQLVGRPGGERVLAALAEVVR